MSLCTAIWWPQVLVWSGIFQLFRISNISGKNENATNPTVSCTFARVTSIPLVWFLVEETSLDILRPPPILDNVSNFLCKK